jgi:hypothetical protein
MVIPERIRLSTAAEYPILGDWVCWRLQVDPIEATKADSADSEDIGLREVDA